MKNQHSYQLTIMQYHSYKYVPQGRKHAQMILKRKEWKQIKKCLTVKSSPINVGYMKNKHG